MMQILFAWEMGANFGHANKVTQVAGALQDRAGLTIAARNVIAMHALDPGLKARLLPAPYCPTRHLHKGESPGQNFAGALLQEGWDNAGNLIALVAAWRNLFDLVQPDVIVAQAAPTALLAARGLGLRTVVLGSGYDAPPRADPMPCFAPEDPAAVALAKAQEARALAAANTALAHVGQPPLTAFCDLLYADATLLVAYPETDHFAPRDKIEATPPPYLGQLLSVEAGAETHFRETGQRRIMAYLRPGSAQYLAGIRGLAALAATMDIILAAPGIDPAQAGLLRERGMQVVDGPVRLDRILGSCDLGVSHGTNGIGSAFAAFGVPQICLPIHHEQMLFARSIARAGLGLGMAGQYEGAQVVEAIEKALAAPGIRARVEQMRHDLPGRDLHRPAARAAEMIIALGNGGTA